MIIIKLKISINLVAKIKILECYVVKCDISIAEILKAET